MSGLRPYEVLILADPRLSDEEVAQLGSRLRELLTGLGGEVLGIDPWGRRRLTFELKKHREASYLLMQIRAEPPVVREFERQLKLNESVLRFLTTRAPARRPGPPAPPPAPSPEPVAEEVG